MQSMIRTRFTPLPVPYLHIGDVRIALFNWLYARRFGGSFILRINDSTNKGTDRTVISDLTWLGVDWDEGPVYQTTRKQHYREVAEALIKMDLAYPDSPSNNNEQGDYRGHNRNLPVRTALELYDDTGWAVRFKVPSGERIVLDDLLKGAVTWDTNRIGDPIILYSGGNAADIFATAVDDAEMKISHVIRGEDHLDSTPLQLLFLQALGHTPPYYAHLPLLREPTGLQEFVKHDALKFITSETRWKLHTIGFNNTEISTRDELNPATLTYYQVLGYKPEALINYLLNLDTELLDLQTIKKTFLLEEVGKAVTSINFNKLNWLAGKYTENDAVELRTLKCMEFLMGAKLIPNPPTAEQVTKVKEVIELCGDRIKTYSDILICGYPFFHKPVYDLSHVAKYINHDMQLLLDVLIALLRHLPRWHAADLEEQTKSFMTLRGLKPVKMTFALRVVMFGSLPGPDVYQAMELLGKQECCERCVEVMQSEDYEDD